MHAIKGICLLIWLGQLLTVTAQDLSKPIYHYPYRHYTPLDGLSQQQTVSIYQDRQGYIWVGTKIGENRFDGTTFNNYTNSKGYSHDHILGFFEDKSNELWSYGRAGIYSHKGDSVENHLPRSFKEYAPHSLVQGWNEEIVFSSGNYNNNLYMLKDGIVEHIDLQGDTALSLQTLVYDQDNLTILAHAYDRARRTTTLVAIDRDYCISKLTSLPLAELKNSILIRAKTGIYFALNFTLYKIENSHLQVVEYLPEFITDVTDIAVRSHDMLVSTRSELWKKNGQGWTNLGIPVNQPYGILVDQEDRIWLPTEEGLIKVTSEAFKIYPQSRGMIRYAWNILEDRTGRLWFASHGYGIMSMKDNVYSAASKSINGRQHDQLYMGGTTLQDGSLLFPSSFGLLHYDVTRGFRHFPGSGSSAVLFAWQEAGSQNIYVGSNSFIIIHPNGDSVVYADKEGLPMKQLKYVNSIIKDKEGAIWLGCSKGVAKFHNNEFEVYFVGEALKAPLITSCKDYRGNVWFGSTHGLYLYDYKTPIPTYVGADIFNGEIAFIREFADDKLMLGVKDGLYLVDLRKYYATGEFHYNFIGVEDGFDGISPIPNGVFKDKTGNYWFCTSSNVLEFEVSKYREEAQDIHLIIHSTDYRADKDTKENTIKQLMNDEPIILSTANRNIKINFHAINYKNPRQMMFRHRLLNYDTIWSSTSKGRSLEFTGLPHGNYTLQVQCFINGQCVADKSTPVFVKASTFFDTNFAKQHLLIVLSVTIVGGFIASFWSKKRKKEEDLNALITNLQLQQRIAEGQINPHFIFNVLNSLQNTIVKGDSEKAEKYLIKFNNIFYPILQTDGLLTRTLKKELEITENYLALEKIRWSEKFNYTITTDNPLNLLIRVPKMLIQTFANNAIKHGLEPKRSNGRLHIHLSQCEGGTQIIIEDNGVGRAAAGSKIRYEPSGNGIKLVEQLLFTLDHSAGNSRKSYVQILDLNDEQETALGTKVIVWINNNFKPE